MVRVRIKKEQGKIVSVSTMGHTDFAQEGSDIVCAGISSIIQTALLGLLQVARIEVAYSFNEEDGIVKFSLPRELTERQRQDADAILETMLCGVADLREGYSDYISLEVK